MLTQNPEGEKNILTSKCAGSVFARNEPSPLRRWKGSELRVGEGPEEEGDVLLLEAEQEEQGWWGGGEGTC